MVEAWVVSGSLLYMRTVNFSDLTGRARIRDAALRLFAKHGFEGTSVRAIAAEAGTSAALVTHHFGSKENLRAAIDEEVLRLVGEAFAEVSMDQPVEQLIHTLGATSAGLFGADPELRGYLRHALLVESEAGVGLYQRLWDGATQLTEQLATAGSLRADADRVWTPFALLLFAIGPLMFEHLLPADAFAPEVLRRRSAVLQQVLLHGVADDTST